MSGGSYDYLSAKDADAVINMEYELGCMADRLAGLGYAEDAAQETTDLMLTIRQVKVRLNSHIDRLSEVWHAVEWWDSGDSGEDDVVEALAHYRKEPCTTQSCPRCHSKNLKVW